MTVIFYECGPTGQLCVCVGGGGRGGKGYCTDVYNWLVDYMLSYIIHMIFVSSNSS